MREADRYIYVIVMAISQLEAAGLSEGLIMIHLLSVEQLRMAGRLWRPRMMAIFRGLPGKALLIEFRVLIYDYHFI